MTKMASSPPRLAAYIFIILSFVICLWAKKAVPGPWWPPPPLVEFPDGAGIAILPMCVKPIETSWSEKEGKKEGG